jgi:WD40 repeat protein
MVSCGVARTLLVWNPYTTDVIAPLDGHATQIVDVAVDEENARLISVDATKNVRPQRARRCPPSAVRPHARAAAVRDERGILLLAERRVSHDAPLTTITRAARLVVRPPLDRRQVRCWDAFTLRCTQTFVDATPYRPVNGVSSLLWDTARGALLTAGHRLTVWPMRARLAPRAKANRSHRAAVCAALYNPHFGQVVSGDALASVHVWSVETGEASNGVAYQDQGPLNN